MAALIPQKMFDEQLAAMDIENFAQAAIRQVGAVGGALEKNSGTEFLHLEMGVPGLPPETVGVEAEQQALAQGHASIYPSITGIAPLKSEASRFVKAFLDIDVAPEGCIPTVGSMQGGFCLFQISSQCDPKKDTILFIDPGFPVQRQQVRILGIKHESFDIYDFRAEKLGPKLESYLKQGNVAAIIYSNPNNPAWICLTESELRTIGELANKYDTIVLEDLAYMGMDFRKELGHPFQAPFQATAARYTDNYVLMISGSKIFSYAGQRIAIVGPTGCGKTTLINLLMRFYDVNGGSIKVSGTDIRDVTRASLRGSYGMVLQDTWLRAGTVRENIAYGKPDATMDEVIAAAKAAHAHSFIRRLPDGYDTVIAEDGGNISQGQKQLLCIARVMLCLPPMLILDEATSSIDTRTEVRIQAAFARMMQGRTSFIVAHRLSTIREADVILVMKDGHIVEQGDHDTLLAQGGFYAKLYNSQFEGVET